MKLYELTQNYNNLYDLLDNEEVPVEVVEEALKGIEDEIEVKFENISKLIKSLEGSVEAFKNEEKRLATRRQSMEKKIGSLKDYMLEQLKIMDRTKVNANTFVVRRQKNPTSYNYEESIIDTKYFVPQEPKLDRKAIKQDLSNGVKINGVTEKEESYHVRIQ